MATAKQPQQNYGNPGPDNPGVKLYTVKNVTEQVRPTMAGKFETVVVVSYETARGAIGTVSIPKEKATVEEVKAAIEADVMRLEAIYNL